MTLRLLRWGVLGYWGVLTVALLLPDPLEPVGAGDGLKSLLEHTGGYVVHFSAFLVLAAWTLSALNGRLHERPQQVLLVVAAVAAYGIASEALQLAVPERTFDLWDIFADVAGAGAGYALWRKWLRSRGGVGRSGSVRLSVKGEPFDSSPASPAGSLG